MAQKPTRIDDVKKPGKAAPAATSRPLIVTNRPIITTDPMMVSSGAAAGETSAGPAPGTDAKPAEPLAHTAKTIKPLDASLTAPELTQSAVAIDQTAQTVADVKSTDAKVTIKVTDQPPATETPAVPDAVLESATNAATINTNVANAPDADKPAIPLAPEVQPDAAAILPDQEDAASGPETAQPAADAPAVSAPALAESVPHVPTADAIASQGADQTTNTPSAADETSGAANAKPTDEEPTDGSAAKPAALSTLGAAETDDAQRDPQAAATAEETAALEAKAVREQELEQLVASGQYFVPINAVQRKRSRVIALLLCLLALVLAAALADAALDVGLVEAPASVPHTNFFSGTH